MRKVNRLQVLGYSLIAFLLLLFTANCNLSPTYAADSTPSADPLRQSDSEATPKAGEASIKSRLEEFKKGIASKAAILKQEVNRKLRDKAYVGKVKAKSETSITLATKNGPKIVNINQDTEFVSSIKDKKFQQKSVSEEDYVAALGDVDETGVLTARRIILLSAPGSELKTYIWGQIVAVSDKLITLKDKAGKNIAISAANIAKIKMTDFVISTGSFGKNDIFAAEFVYVIPQGGVLKPKKVATTSAKIASPSARPLTPERSDGERATPKPSPKPTPR